MKDFEKKARAYALKNAIAHKGKAAQGAVISALFVEGLQKEDIPKKAKELAAIIQEVNAMTLAEQEQAFAKAQSLVSEREVRVGLAELPDVSKKGVVMRFGPAPSGPMHLGHAIVGSLNFVYYQKYGGKFYVRIEDTDPENVHKEMYPLMKKDAAWLFNNEGEIIIQSDRMELYYQYAEKFIAKKAAYVCSCSQEDFKVYVEKKEDCPCRSASAKEQLVRWKDMFDAQKTPKGKAVLRFKSSMQDKNPAMRDFPLARIIEHPHPLQGTKYRVWPLMNLAVTVDDIELGMTHIIRGKDHQDNALRQEMMFKVLGKKYPWATFIGRYKIEGAELSKTKIFEGIQNKTYSGYEDPRIQTIASLRARGYKPEAFWHLAEHIGLSEVDKHLELTEFFKILDGFNK